MIQTWNNLLEELIDKVEFKSSIDEKGFFKSDTRFREFVEEYNFEPSTNTAQYLSINFWSEQSNKLRNNGYYLLRTGQGKFAIFDQEKFPKPYLELDTRNSIKLGFEVDDEFRDLAEAFDTRQENPGLEHLNVTGVYNSLIRELFGKDEKWYIGPRGQKSSQFKVFGKTVQDEIVELYDYDGLEELDYTIWTKDHILLFEAKAVTTNSGLDMGWHKICYPASRFKNYTNRKIIPIYLLKWENTTHLFVFPIFDFHDNKGIIINDNKKMIPEKIFQIDFGDGNN